MAGQLTIDTLRASSGVLATQNGMTGIPKAWVSFTNVSGTITITSSFNVSSVARTATGQYNINFTTTLPNANYSISGMASFDGGSAGGWGRYISAPQGSYTTSQLGISTVYTYNNTQDCVYNFVQIYSS